MDKDESSHYTESPKDFYYQAQTAEPWSCLLCLLPPLEGYGHLTVKLAVSSHSPLLHPQFLQSLCLLHLQVNKPLFSILSCLPHPYMCAWLFIYVIQTELIYCHSFICRLYKSIIIRYWHNLWLLPITRSTVYSLLSVCRLSCALCACHELAWTACRWTDMVAMLMCSTLLLEYWKLSCPKDKRRCCVSVHNYSILL